MKTNKILFIDIETVPQIEKYEELDSTMQELWAHKCKTFRNSEDKTPTEQYQRAGIYAEFGKIICISTAVLTEGANSQFRIKTFSGNDEKEVLIKFCEMLLNMKGNWKFCGHNIKEFDIPFIARRLIINDLQVPNNLNMVGVKPWESPLIDTLEYWKFGDYKHYTSLNLLTHILNIPSPKNEMDGSKVYEEYYAGNLSKIAEYCQNDVIAVAKLYLKLNSKPLFIDKQIVVL